jgi:thiamine transport system substrate-binding protein
MNSARHPLRTGLGALFCLCFLAAGCADDNSVADAGGSGEETPTVRVLTYDAFALSEEAAAAFEEATGATIEIVAAGDGATMLAGALLTAGSPEADVIFGIDNTTAAEVGSAPLLVDYRPPAASDLPEELAAPPSVADQLTPIDTSEVCINIDEAWFADKGLVPPAGFEDLIDPMYRGLLSVENPVNSTPGLAFLMGTVDTYGEDGFPAYWEALEDNDVRVAPSWDDAYYNDYTVSGGDRPLVVSYASSPPAEVVFSEGARTEPVSSVLESTCVTQVEYAGVLAGAEQPELAEELVAFMLGDEWQSELPLSNFVYPVTDVELPEEFRKWAPRPQDAIKVDPMAVGESRDEWIEQWRDVME